MFGATHVVVEEAISALYCKVLWVSRIALYKCNDLFIHSYQKSAIEMQSYIHSTQERLKEEPGLVQRSTKFPH